MPTDAQKRATAKYKKTHYKQIHLQLQHSDYERLKTYCDAHEIPVSTFIKQSIVNRLDQLELSANEDT